MCLRTRHLRSDGITYLCDMVHSSLIIMPVVRHRPSRDARGLNCRRVDVVQCRYSPVIISSTDTYASTTVFCAFLTLAFTFELKSVLQHDLHLAPCKPHRYQRTYLSKWYTWPFSSLQLLLRWLPVSQLFRPRTIFPLVPPSRLLHPALHGFNRFIWYLPSLKT